MRLRLGALFARGRYYRHRYGWRRFFLRMLRFWVWLPRVMRVRRLHRAAPPSPDLPFGVNVIGYLSGLGSFAEVARLTLESFKAAGVPVAPVDLTMKDVPDRNDLPQFAGRGTNPYAVNVLATGSARPPEEVTEILGEGYMYGRTNVCIWSWEFPQVPLVFGPHLSIYDEVWVPSAFNRDSASPHSKVPIVCVPHPMRFRTPPVPGQPPLLAAIPEDATVFLFIFHYHHLGYDRKNARGLVEAFRRAFTPEENVWLVIKSEFGAARGALRDLRARAEGNKVRIIDAWLSRAELDALIARCDCYVSLHRAEGFGMTMAEAMAFAKPVIATAYSGNLEYMTPSNSYLVDYRLIELGPQYRGSAWEQDWLWADPNLEQAAAYMRHVYEHPDEARMIGWRAREDVQRLLSTRAIGDLMKERLLRLENAQDDRNRDVRSTSKADYRPV